MNKTWKTFYQLFVANGLMALVVILKFNRLPPQIPLFFSKPTGEDQLADTWLIVLLPFFMNFFFFLNNYIFSRFFNHDQLVKKIIYYLNIFLLISFTLVFIKIIFIIT